MGARSFYRATGSHSGLEVGPACVRCRNFGLTPMNIWTGLALPERTGSAGSSYKWPGAWLEIAIRHEVSHNPPQGLPSPCRTAFNPSQNKNSAVGPSNGPTRNEAGWPGTIPETWRCGLVKLEQRSLGFLIICHAAYGALLGLIAGLAMMALANRGFASLASMHDPEVEIVLFFSLSSLMAVGSGISAFILINIEPASAQ